MVRNIPWVSKSCFYLHYVVCFLSFGVYMYLIIGGLMFRILFLSLVYV